MQWLYHTITMGILLNYQIPFCLWTLNKIRASQVKERAILSSKNSVYRWLNPLGRSPSVPCVRLINRMAGNFNAYFGQSYPQAVGRGKRYRVRLYFMDKKAEAGKYSIQSEADWKRTLLSVMQVIQQQAKRQIVERVNSFFKLPKTLYAKEFV